MRKIDEFLIPKKEALDHTSINLTTQVVPLLEVTAIDKVHKKAQYQMEAQCEFPTYCIWLGDISEAAVPEVVLYNDSYILIFKRK